MLETKEKRAIQDEWLLSYSHQRMHFIFKVFKFKLLLMEHIFQHPPPEDTSLRTGTTT